MPTARLYISHGGDVTDLAGKTDLEQARADMLADCMNDATRTFRNPAFIMNPDQDAKVDEVLICSILQQRSVYYTCGKFH